MNIEKPIKIDVNINALCISFVVISGYMEELKKSGIIDEQFTTIHDSGKKIISVSEKFNWTPTDEEIKAFILGVLEESVPEKQIFYLCTLKQYRDDKEGLLKKFKKEEIREIENTDKQCCCGGMADTQV